MSSLGRYLTIRRGTAVRRFHTVPILIEETVGHHSCNLATLLWTLTNGEVRKELLLGAVMHDVPEHITGDIPSPMKRMVSGLLNEVEAVVFQDIGFNVEDLSTEENLLFRIADVLDLMFKVREELSLGNRPVQEIFDRAHEYAHETLVEYKKVSSKYLDNITMFMEYLNDGQ